MIRMGVPNITTTNFDDLPQKCFIKTTLKHEDYKNKVRVRTLIERFPVHSVFQNSKIFCFPLSIQARVPVLLSS